MDKIKIKICDPKASTLRDLAGLLGVEVGDLFDF